MGKQQHPSTLLRAWLNKTGWLPIRLARVLGVNPSQVTRWLKRQRRPGHALALRLELLTDGAVPADSWVWAFPEEIPEHLAEAAEAGGRR